MQIREFQEESNALKELGESVAEGVLDGRDDTAGILIRTKSCKIRKLSRAIADDLKEVMVIDAKYAANTSVNHMVPT